MMVHAGDEIIEGLNPMLVWRRMIDAALRESPGEPQAHQPEPLVPTAHLGVPWAWETPEFHAKVLETCQRISFCDYGWVDLVDGQWRIIDVGAMGEATKFVEAHQRVRQEQGGA